jgi:hypothetical protein
MATGLRVEDRLDEVVNFGSWNENDFAFAGE